MEGKKVAVLIPTLNEAGTIKSMLDSLNQNSYPNKEIIIIDGGSTDGTVETAKESGATVLIETGPMSKRCPANAWNQGARYTDADILCFVDGDGESVESDFLTNGVNAFDEKTSAVYGFYMTKIDTWIERIMLQKTGRLMNPTFVRKDVFSAIGGFPLIGYGEDWLFMKRVREHARKNGMKEGLVEKPFFTGHGVHSLKALHKQKVWYGRTSFLFLKNLDDRSFMNIIKVFFQPIYFISFLTLFLLPFSVFFVFATIPFFIVFFAILLKNFGHWGMGKIFINLISGCSMLYGMLVSVFSKKARKGR